MGGITPIRAAYDRDYTQEIVPLAETILFQSLATEHIVDCRGKVTPEGGHCLDRGIWFGKSEANPEHIVGTENGVIGARTTRRLEPTKHSETSLSFEIQRVPWDLVPNAPRRGHRRNTRHLHQPYHQFTKTQTDDRSCSSSDSSSSSSLSTQPLATHQWLQITLPPET